MLGQLEGNPPAGGELYRVLDAKAAQRMVDLLKSAGREARVYEAGSKRVAGWFADGGSAALVAVGSTAFPDVRKDVRRLCVMNLPLSLEAAVADLQLVGADGLLAEADFFASAEDREYRLLEIEKKNWPTGERTAAARRLGLAVGWLEHDGCAREFLSRQLGGETSGPCGNCGWCLGRRGVFLP